MSVRLGTSTGSPLGAGVGLEVLGGGWPSTGAEPRRAPAHSEPRRYSPLASAAALGKFADFITPARSVTREGGIEERVKSVELSRRSAPPITDRDKVRAHSRRGWCGALHIQNQISDSTHTGIEESF
jgi:hypothetical protein